MTTRENRWDGLLTPRQAPLSPTEDELLAALLTEAGAPGTPTELRGEAQALAHFRRHVGAAAHRTRTLSLVPLGRALVDRKRLLAGVASTAIVGGLAASAMAGVLPSRFFHTPPDEEGRRPHRVNGHVVASSTTSTTSTPARSGSTAVHVVPGLCRFWLLAPGDPVADLAGLPFFHPLVTAAGGARKVDTYCLAQVGPPPVCPTPPVVSPQATPTPAPVQEPQREPRVPERERSGQPGGDGGPPVTPAPTSDMPPTSGTVEGVPHGWPRPEASAWPARWPETWPTAAGRDAAAWRSWRGWTGYCATSTAAPTATTVSPSCARAAGERRECPTRTAWVRPTASPSPDQPRNGVDPCPDGAACGEPGRRGERPPADQAGAGAADAGAPPEASPRGRGDAP